MHDRPKWKKDRERWEKRTVSYGSHDFKFVAIILSFQWKSKIWYFIKQESLLTRSLLKRRRFVAPIPDAILPHLVIILVVHLKWMFSLPRNEIVNTSWHCAELGLALGSSDCYFMGRLSFFLSLRRSVGSHRQTLYSTLNPAMTSGSPNLSPLKYSNAMLSRSTLARHQ
jgi:hypothetical protein